MSKPSFIVDSGIIEAVKNFKKSENKRRILPENIEVFQPEAATECGRRLVYRASSVKPDFELKAAEVYDSKHRWISTFMRMPNVSVLGVDIMVSDMAYNVSGIIDLIVQFDNHRNKSIVIIRESNDDSLKKIHENGPYRKDVVTCQTYMWLSEIPSCIMIYENNLNKEFEIFNVIAYNSIIGSVRDKLKALIPYRLNGQVPQRPYPDSNSKECSLCEYRTLCWKQ